MANAPIFTSLPRAPLTQLNPSHATRFRPIWTPGASGSRIEHINIASIDASANTVQLAIGRRVTLGSGMGSGLFVDGGGGSDTITRSAGSFVTDGWLVGDRMTLLGSTTLANDFMAILTGVAAGTLTFATATVAAAEALLSTTGIYRLGLLAQLAVAANAGASTTASVSGLNPALAPGLDPSPDRNLRLGPDDVLFAAAGTALGSGEIIDITVIGADY